MLLAGLWASKSHGYRLLEAHCTIHNMQRYPCLKMPKNLWTAIGKTGARLWLCNGKTWADEKNIAVKPSVQDWVIWSPESFHYAFPKATSNLLLSKELYQNCVGNRYEFSPLHTHKQNMPLRLSLVLSQMCDLGSCVLHWDRAIRNMSPECSSQLGSAFVFARICAALG